MYLDLTGPEEVTLAGGAKYIIKSRPHCHQKHNEHSVVVHHKVQVVAKGYTQVPGVDFEETFAPIMQLESVQAVLHISARNNWNIDHLDITVLLKN